MEAQHRPPRRDTVAPLRSKPGAHQRRPASMRQAPLSTSLGVAWDHPRILACLLATLLALPMLLVTTHASGSHSPSFEVSTASANEGRSATQIAFRQVADHIASTTTAAPSTTAPATTAPASTWTEPETTEPASTAPSTTAWTPPATTTPPATAWQPPATTTPPRQVAAAGSGRFESGQATYYAHNPSGCASRTVPRGTTVTVTASDGASITCTVDDYGPFGAGRIIDLSEQGFAQLASLGTGVISVTVTW